jgi:hypothetical protein
MLEKSVNKILAYMVIAILLGSVTMVVPLALLGPDNLVPADTTNTLSGSGEELSERSDTLAPSEAASQQADSYDNSSKTPQSVFGVGEADVAASLSSMGLIAVPGFLVALAVFVYLKKRTV